LKTCRALGATLINAKLDRLARNVHFVSGLVESGVEFTAVDFPQANRLTVHILAAVAEHEAKMISERTKAAFAAAKRRGVKLGGDRGARLTVKARLAGVEAVQTRANERAADLGPIVRELQAAGATSLRALAAALNDRGIRTRAASANGRPARSLNCWRGCGGAVVAPSNVMSFMTVRIMTPRHRRHLQGDRTDAADGLPHPR
jgi:DNA invertase Pin-like site-specific DNA recombinase